MSVKAATPAFAPIKTHRAFEVICDRIRAELASGALKVGDKLPPERELSAQFQVSRAALREALRSLEVAGIIRNVKGSKGGAFIQAAEPDRIVQAMQDYFHLSSLTLDELTEARIALMDIVVRLACARADESDIAELEAIAEKTRQATGVEARYQCAVDYYAVLTRATRNRMFGVMTQSLSQIMHEFVIGPGYETLQEELFDSRIKLAGFIRQRKAEAASEEMRTHLERVRDHVQKNLNSRREAG